jgi:hypothetical protein
MIFCTKSGGIFVDCFKNISYTGVNQVNKRINPESCPELRAQNRLVMELWRISEMGAEGARCENAETLRQKDRGYR